MLTQTLEFNHRVRNKTVISPLKPQNDVKLNHGMANCHSCVSISCSVSSLPDSWGVKRGVPAQRIHDNTPSPSASCCAVNKAMTSAALLQCAVWCSYKGQVKMSNFGGYLQHVCFGTSARCFGAFALHFQNHKQLLQCYDICF